MQTVRSHTIELKGFIYPVNDAEVRPSGFSGVFYLLKIKNMITNNQYHTHLKCYLMYNVLKVKTGYPISKENINLIDALMNIRFHFPISECEGVYKIIFEDGSYYIGKSKNIIKRIWEHICETENLKYNLEFYSKLKTELNNDVIVLKLSNNTFDEYKMLELNLSTDFNYCYNKIKNSRNERLD